MNAGGYIPLRRGLLDHLEQGRLTTYDAGIYARILLEANRKTGVWWGSAAKLLALAPADSDLRKVQRSLEHLEEIGFIRRFHMQGKRGNYPTFVNKFLCTDGALKGMRLNAAKSNDWRRPSYEPCADRRTDVGGDTATDADTDVTPLREGEVKRDRDKRVAKAEPSLLVFSGLHLKVTERQDRLLGEAFPWVDRRAEYRKADSWSEANPDRRPRSKFGRFLHSWFTKIPIPKEADRNAEGTKRSRFDNVGRKATATMV